MREAVAVPYLSRAVWMLVQSCRQPRTVRAYDSALALFQSEQGIVAGCSHATTVLEVLRCRPMRRLTPICPAVTPRQL
eukprot:3816662-Pyramimonas_sp.AAC.1